MFSRIMHLFHKDEYRAAKWVAAVGVLFYLFEALIHGFGLPILEHDKIFEPTADRYIAIMGLTLGCMLIMCMRDFRKYRHLFILVMAMIFLTIVNGFYINSLGGYGYFFGADELDRQIYWIGVGSVIWYPLMWLTWWKRW